MKAKSIISLLTVLLLVLSCVGCAQQPAQAEQEAPPSEAPATEAEATPLPIPAVTTWAEENQINNGSQTVDELYELAKQEGTVVLYSISSRCVQVKESFEAQYPGVICDAYDISTNELLEKITREYESGVRNADVIHCKDQDGALYIEKVATGIFHNYYPDDIVKTISNQNYLTYAMPLYIELNQWFYNYETYPDGPPVDSWWDLTRPEWKGKLLISNPIDNVSYMAIFTAFTAYHDELAADYEREFGEPLTLSEGCPTAAHELMKRLVANDLVFIASSDEICESVGTAGSKADILGYAASSKLRKNESDGWVLAPINMLPTTGIPAQNNLYIVNEAPHPNAAKLLVRWMTGEADGKGAGFEPFNTLGGWSVRDNVPLAEGSTPLTDLHVWDFNPMYVYENLPDVMDFWISLQN